MSDSRSVIARMLVRAACVLLSLLVFVPGALATEPGSGPGLTGIADSEPPALVTAAKANVTTIPAAVALKCKAVGGAERVWSGTGSAPEAGAVEVGGEVYLLALHKHPEASDLLALLRHKGPPVIWLRDVPQYKLTNWVSAGDRLIAVGKGKGDQGVVLVEWKLDEAEAAARKGVSADRIIAESKIVQRWDDEKLASSPRAAWSGKKLAVSWAAVTQATNGNKQSLFSVALLDLAAGTAAKPLRLGPVMDGPTANGTAVGRDGGFWVIWKAGERKDFSKLLQLVRLTDDGAVEGEALELPWSEIPGFARSCGGRLVAAWDRFGIGQVALADESGATKEIIVGQDLRPRLNRPMDIACVEGAPVVGWDRFLTKPQEGSVHVATLQTTKPVDATVKASKRTNKTGMAFNTLLVSDSKGFSVVWSEEHPTSSTSMNYDTYSQALKCSAK